MDINSLIRTMEKSFVYFPCKFDWEVAGNFIRDVAVAISAIWAVWEGRKGIKKYLLDEDIKERVKRIRDSNVVVHNQAREIMEEIEALTDNDKPASDDDVKDARDQAEKLSKYARGASSSIQTYAFFLRQILAVVQPKYEAENSFARLFKHDLFNSPLKNPAFPTQSN